MNKVQRMLLAIYAPLLLLLLVLDPSGEGFRSLQYTRYAVVFSLFLAVAVMDKPYPLQRAMAPAFAGMAAGDFFLVFLHLLTPAASQLAWLGMVCFMAAYLCLARAYGRERTGRGVRLPLLLPPLLASTVIAASLSPYLQGPLRLLGLVFLGLLSLMTYRAWAAAREASFAPRVARCLALSALLMFLCDGGIAFSLFHPLYSRVYPPLLKNLVWCAYLGGWVLAGVVIADEAPYGPGGIAGKGGS